MNDFRIADEPWWDDIRVVCTGGLVPGTTEYRHPSRELMMLSLDRETGELGVVGNGQSRTGHTIRRKRLPPHGRFGDIPSCPSCGRDPRLSTERLRQVAELSVSDQWTGARGVLDVSLFPE